MSAPFGAGPLRIITADERLREARGIKGVLTGTSGIGKTTQLLTLDPQHTLFLNLEAGELAVQGWPGDEIRIRDWEVARDLAAFKVPARVWVSEQPLPKLGSGKIDKVSLRAHFREVHLGRAAA